MCPGRAKQAEAVVGGAIGLMFRSGADVVK